MCKYSINIFLCMDIHLTGLIVITTGKIMAEPENVSALIAVINNMIHTFLLSFS